MKKSLLLLILSVISVSSIYAAAGDTTIVRVHDRRDIGWYGDYNQFGVFPDTSKKYERVYLRWTLGCASTGCSHWDYDVYINIIPKFHTDSNIARIDTVTPAPLVLDTVWNRYYVGEKFEVARLITPYGTYMDGGTNGFNNSWEHQFLFDVTDYQNMLRDSVYVNCFYSGWSSGFATTLDFIYIEGTPARDVLKIENVYKGSYGYANTTDFETNRMPARPVRIIANANHTKLKVTVSGHGFDNTEYCGEFCAKKYYVKINGVVVDSQLMWKDDCGSNNVYPQGGTWLYNRANWCPGDKVKPFEHELNNRLPAGTDDSIDIDIEPYTWGPHASPCPVTGGTCGNQTPSHSFSVQLITYGPKNYALDAAITDIIAPTNSDEHIRMNPICGSPVIKIQNRGINNLISAYITYGITGGSPCYYHWTGNLGYMQSEEVMLPTFNWSGIDTTLKEFHAELSLPNYGLDENSINNTMKSIFRFAPVFDSSFVIILKTNLYAAENRYTLTDEDGNVLYSRICATNNFVYRDTVNLSTGCYTFLLKDYDPDMEGGDGLQWWANSDGAGVLDFRRNTRAVSYLMRFDEDFGNEVRVNFTVGEFGGNQTKVCNDMTDIPAEPALNIDFTVFPNPTKGSVIAEVNLHREEKARLSVVNFMGQELKSETFTSKEKTSRIDLSSYPAGMYFIQLQSSGGSTVRKVILDK